MLDRFVRDMVIYLPSKLLPALTGFITVPILTRLLTTTEFGNYALATGVYEFLFALACSGLGAGAVRLFPVYKKQDRLGAFFSALGTSTGLAVVLVSAFSLLALKALTGRLPADLHPLLFISILAFSVQASFIVLMQVIRAQERSKLYTTFELAANYGSLGLGLLLLYLFDWGVGGLLWGTFIAFALALGVLLPIAVGSGAPHNWRFSPGDLGVLWRYAWPLALGNMAMWGLRLSDRYLISAFRSRAEVGLYAAAYNISSKSIDILVAVFLLSMGPMVINIWEKLGQGPTQQCLKTTTRVFLILCLPAAAGVSVLAHPFVALLTDKAYHEGYRIVGFVAFSSLAYGLAQIAGIGLLIAKRTHLIAVNQILAALVNLGLNLGLVSRFGFVAAGATTLAGYVLLLLLQAISARHYLSWPFPYRTLRNTGIACLATSLIAGGIYGFSTGGGGLQLGYLLLSVISGVLVYGVCLVFLGEFEDREMAVIKQAWGKATSRLRVIPF